MIYQGVLDIRTIARATLGAALLVACGPEIGHRSTSAPGTQTPVPLPRWCEAVDQALQGSAHEAFQCLPVPSFLVTGFFGPPANPERSDFLEACFAGDEEAAHRLRLAVRPVGNLSFKYATSRQMSTQGSLDLSFLGPWAPGLRAEHAAKQRVEVAVELADAEIRVLSSVGEILSQEYEGAREPKLRSSLERCIDNLCAQAQGEPGQVYTAKVLAAVPVIRVRFEKGARLDAAATLMGGATGFEVKRATEARGSFVIQAKDKLNVAALLEPARQALERGAACQAVRAHRARRSLTEGLQELGLRTVAERDLAKVPERAAELRQQLTRAGPAFSEHERRDSLASLEAMETAARQLQRKKPDAKTCQAQKLLSRVLSQNGEGNLLHAPLKDIAQPLYEKLTELANTHSLPCAQPLWYRDGDGDGYGDPKQAQRGPQQPKGYVANSLDCYDGNPQAYPGQTRAFAQHRGDGKYDYDCDGKSKPMARALSEGCRVITTFAIPTRCWADAGWQRAVPACGERGKWLAHCETSLLSCEASKEEERVQICR